MIYLLTGPVRSGKTTSLMEWAKGRNDVHGILTPDIKGKRVFLDIKTKTPFPMEATPGEETVSVGRFSFSKKYFEQAVMVIRTAINKTGWLVIDEAGPLELKGQGFAPVLKELFISRKNKIILVVREGIAERVSNCFGLSVQEIKLIDTSLLIQLQ